MAQRAAKGESVGQMFVTDSRPDEYSPYSIPKARREQREAEAKAKKARAEAQVKAPAKADSMAAESPPPGK